MKYIFTLLATFGTVTIFSQTIDYTYLTGSWFCYKSIQPSGNTASHIADYKESHVFFSSDSTFSEEGIYAKHITTTGTYCLNKENNKITFKNLHDRTRDPDALVLQKTHNYMYHERPEEIIVSLSKDTLVIIELPADTIYYRRMK